MLNARDVDRLGGEDKLRAFSEGEGGLSAEGAQGGGGGGATIVIQGAVLDAGAGLRIPLQDFIHQVASEGHRLNLYEHRQALQRRG